MKKSKKVSKILALAISAVIIFASVQPANAMVVKSGILTDDSGFRYFLSCTESSDCACIVSYNGEEEKVSIPSELGGYSVTELFTSSPFDYPTCDGVFYNNQLVTDVSIPSTVERIGDYTFVNSMLRNITLSEGLKQIGHMAFSTTGIYTIEIPSSVEYIDPSAFSICSNLTDILVDPDNPYYTSVDGVLYNKDLTELITVPGSRRNTFTIPDYVEKISDYAFNGCSHIKDIVIPDSVTKIGDFALNGCDEIENLILPNSVTDMGSSAVSYCDSLKSVKLPENLTYIPDCLFEGCTKLQDVKIPKSVEIIGSHTFMNCSNLKNIEIPSEVQFIYHFSFEGCRNLVIKCRKGSAAHAYALENNIASDLYGMYGDIDDDNLVTAGDALSVLRNSIENEIFNADQKIAADVDFDFKITANDAFDILRDSIFENIIDQNHCPVYQPMDVPNTTDTDNPIDMTDTDDTDIYDTDYPIDMTDTDDTDIYDTDYPVDTCDTVTRNPQPDGTPDTPEQGARIFGAKLFKNLYNKGENMLISPVSAYTALAMLENGADNTTCKEILTMLTGGSESVSEQNLNDYMKKYIEYSNSSQELRLANLIYITNREDVSVIPDFSQKTSDYYFAELFSDTPNEKTASLINAWISQHTNGAVKNALSPESLNQNTNSILVNATAFDGKWEKEYTDYQVRKYDFTNYDNSKTEVDFLCDTHDYYYSDDLSKAFVKYYKGPYSYIGILPNENVGIDEYIRLMNGSTITNLLSNSKRADVYAHIPKYEFNFSYGLSDTLENMGMVSAFDETSADFGRMVKVGEGKNTFVDGVCQLTHIKVDEKGTKAEAVTIISDSDGDCADEYETIEIYLDRPFIYVIYDTVNKMPIFIGTVCDMSSYQAQE